MARIAKLKTVRGVRRLIQGQPDPDFVLRPGFLEAIRLLPKYDLSFDICILHPQMQNTLAMMRQCPEVSFVLDHIGKPGIKAGLADPWRAQLREMAAMPNVVCKLSGVTTEADHHTWTRDQLRPYIDHVVDCFGPDRILYGGDWPVSELAGSYCNGWRPSTGRRPDLRRLTSASSFATTPSRPIGCMPDGRPSIPRGKIMSLLPRVGGGPERFFGKYRGIVVDNIDPLQIARIRAQVPAVLGETPSSWALPCAPAAGIQAGCFIVPPVGSQVWIEFERGDPDFPIWTGGFWGLAADVPVPALAPAAIPPGKTSSCRRPARIRSRERRAGSAAGGGITLKAPGGAMIVVNETGVFISNGKGATITLFGPVVSVNSDALAVVGATVMVDGAPLTAGS